jgi:tryptophanyl-tRNA synthetase
MQPSGLLHLGNLLGALDNWKALQEKYECFFFVADWHAISTNYADTSRIKEFTRELLIDWLAAGIDPQRAAVFIQSRNPDHAILHLLLSMIVPVPWLERNPTYKEKQEEIKDRDLSTYGFLGYPVLQAADILIYKANYVPVGQDQLPHIELTREIARRFNHFYGPVFPEPAAKITEVPRVRGTDGEKMSKSRDNCIYLAESPGEVTAKVRPMMTDPARKRRSDPGDPEKCPVYDLHKVFTPIGVRETTIIPGCTRALFGCLDCKDVLLQHMLPIVTPIRE